MWGRSTIQSHHTSGVQKHKTLYPPTKIQLSHKKNKQGLTKQICNHGHASYENEEGCCPCQEGWYEAPIHEEEISALEKNNIPFEIIPGVSSANAAAAAAKIPLTRRLHSRRLQFITGHDFNGNLPDDLHISSLTDSNSTTVIFMGKKTFPNLCSILLETGMDKNTHALVVENVSRSDEKVTKGSIVEISEYLQKNSNNDPAVIIFGSVI